MIRIFLVLFCIVPLWAQLPDGDHSVDKPLWSSSYLATYRDQMVHGERFYGYPGPLPKMLYVLGQDVDHRAVDFELTQIVDRDAPTWWGICNGWAAAAIAFDEPNETVIRGVKLFTGDMKAILTAIHKDTSGVIFGAQDPVFGGMSAREFAQTLETFVVDKGESVVLDIDISDETWNYPVSRVIVDTNEVGEWTEVTARIYTPALVELTHPYDTEIELDFTYTYRYKTATQEDYQWTGSSTEDHPQRGWRATNLFLRGIPEMNGNHFFNLQTYARLLELASAENAKDDIFEPNNEKANAAVLNTEMQFGSLLPGDVDWFVYDLLAGETFSLQFRVYDGPGVRFVLEDENGQVVTAFTDLSEWDYQYVVPSSGRYYLRIDNPPVDDVVPGESYYRLFYPVESGSYSVNRFAAERVENLRVRALSVSDDPGEFIAGTVGELPANGSVSVVNPNQGETFKSLSRTVWVEEFAHAGRQEKRYHRDHVQHAEYVVPHMTCRNNWKTRIDFISENPSAENELVVYNGSGNELQRVSLTLNKNKRFSGSLNELLSPASIDQGAYFKVFTTLGNQLYGTVDFVNGLGETVVIDLASRAAIGNFRVFDLPAVEVGGTGISIVNTAEVANEIFMWVKSRNGQEKSEEVFTLQPGQRRLFTANALLSEGGIQAGDYVHFHAQYTVEGLAVQYRAQPYSLYGHRLLNDELDGLRDSVVALPEDRSQLAFIFANFNETSLHVLFEGYDSEGNLHGRFNIELGRPLLAGEVRHVTLEHILENGVNIVDLDAITHFRLTASRPFFVMEKVGAPDRLDPVIVHPPLLYNNP